MKVLAILLLVNGCAKLYPPFREKGREAEVECFRCVDSAYAQCVKSGFPEEDCYKAKTALKIRCWPLHN